MDVYQPNSLWLVKLKDADKMQVTEQEDTVEVEEPNVGRLWMQAGVCSFFPFTVSKLRGSWKGSIVFF